MEIDSYEEIKINFQKLINLDEYFDYILLDPEEFMNKYEYYGWRFSNYFEIRFEKDVDAVRTIQDFIDWHKDLILIPVESKRKVYKINSENISSYLQGNNLNTEDFILFHKGTKWILVKNRFNKLIGIGSYIIKRMKKNCFMTFGGIKIEYAMTDMDK